MDVISEGILLERDLYVKTGIHQKVSGTLWKDDCGGNCSQRTAEGDVSTYDM